MWAEGPDEAIEDCLTSIWFKSAEIAQQDRIENPDCYEDDRSQLFEITLSAAAVRPKGKQE